MNTAKIFLLIAVFIISTFSQAHDIKPAEVKKVMQKVADWQIYHINDLYSGHNKSHHPLDWTKGALSVSLVKWAAMAEDDKYYSCLKGTGERKYLDFLMAEYKATTDLLFDNKESLYYRDQSRIGKLDNGIKIFWSRGNGWVFAGLTDVMNELDPVSKEYKYFLKIYDELVAKCPRFERKGKTVPYTSANWHMFSLLNKDGEIGIRFSKPVQKNYIEEFDSTISKSYNSIMHGYVLIHNRILKDLNDVAKYLDESHDYVMSPPISMLQAL